MKYAKLACPTLFQTQARPRLFTLIDGLRQTHPVVWIASPPGAGKTSLAASYLAERAIPTAWCQLDAADGDPATLFFFLSEAVKGITSTDEKVAAPGLQSNSVEQVFFRDLYRRLPAGSVLVLDNVQEFDWTYSGHVLETAFREIPSGINIMVLSREAPPASLSRMEVSGGLAVLGWDALRLDNTEMLALAGLDGTADDEVSKWLALVDGWAAGVVMLRNLRARGVASATPLLDSRDAVFRYFAGEIFGRLTDESRELLLLLACLPGLSAADAELLTESPAAPELLEQLYRDRLFTERRNDGSQTYHFHALFREFLATEARQRLNRDVRDALLARAAIILEQRGRVDEAATLYQEASAHEGLAGLMQRHAAGMLSSGRGQIWRDWMSTLPSEAIEASPWLWYWHGVSVMDVSPMRARQMLTKAAQAFRKSGDRHALLTASAAIIDTYDHEWAELDALPALVQELLGLHDTAGNTELAPELDLRLHSRLVLAKLLTAPDSPRLSGCADRALAALALVSDPLEKLTAGAILLRYFDWAGSGDVAAWLVRELNKFADDPAVSPFHRVWWYGRVARWYSKDGRIEEAGATAGAAKNIVNNFELDPLLFQFLEVNHLLGLRDLAGARVLLDQIRASLPPTRKIDWLEFYALDMQHCALAGDTAGALKAARANIELSTSLGLASRERARVEAQLAALCALNGEADQARRWLDSAQTHSHGHDSQLILEETEFIGAFLDYRNGDIHAAVAALGRALTAHRARQSTTLFRTVPMLASHLAAIALKHEIEPQHVRALVKRQQLTAPYRQAINWPWPVAVRTLGRFELSLYGEPVVASGKAQQRPLMLLKALVGAGSQGRSQSALWAQLWPDGDDPKSALNVTVHRLRKLLERDDLVVVTAGSVQLLDGAVWSDVAALADLCTQVDGFNASASAAMLEDTADSLLALYRGAFCEGEEESWMLSTALRWQGRFVGAVTALGSLLENRGNWAKAGAIYHRALDVEPLAEGIYRSLMRCAAEQGDMGGALAAYRRCKEMLSIIAGRQPSTDTERFVVQLGIKA